MHLCIVDDDREFGQTLKKTLADFGQISFVETYREATRKINDEKIDVLIFDYFLPDGKGLDLVRLSASNLQNTKTILMSGSASKEIAMECVNLQISAIIEKPFLGSEIKEIIKKLVLTKKISICERDCQVDICGHIFSLTPIEFKIFKLFFDHSDKRLSRTVINEKIWGQIEVSENSLDTHLGNIKKKMKNYSQLLTNVKGHGYNLKVD